jgi:hypothetical protein
MRFWKLLAVLFAVTLFFAACSDDDGDESSDDTSDESSDDGSSDDTSDDGSSDDTSDDESSDDEEASGDFDCEDVSSAFEELGTGSASDPDSVSEAFQEVADNGPEELQDDAQVIADAMEGYNPDDPLESADVFTDPEFAEALTNFGTSLATACLDDAQEQLDDLDVSIPSLPE